MPMQTLQHIGAYAPSLSAIIVVWILYGKKHVGDLLGKLIRVKFHWAWYLFAILSAPLIMALSFFLARSAWGIEVELPIIEEPYLLFIFLPYIFFLGGPLGEELGWRGFALPRLMNRLSPFFAALILGSFWAVWHLPQFYMAGTVQSGIPFLGYVVVTVFNSILITLCFIKSGGSVFSAMLFHLFSNFSYSLFPIFDRTEGQISIGIVYAVVLVIICFVFRRTLFRSHPVLA